MKRTIYLIDYENVHEAGLQGMESCPAGCSIHLFYSQNANRLNLDLLRGLKASFCVHKVHPGRQSLDMQLVSYLGYLIGREGPDCRYVIVSKDRDFANTPLFWQTEADVEVVRQATLDGSEPPAAAASTSRRVTRNRRTQASRPAEESAAEPAETADVSAEEPVVLAVTIEAAPEEAPAAAAAEPQETAAPAEQVVPVPEAETAPTPAPVEPQEPQKTAKTGRQRKPAGKRARQEPASRPASKPAPAQPDRKTRLNNRLMQVLSENQVDNTTTMKAVAVTISHYSDKNIKQMTYRSIIREFGQKRGLELYNLIKPVLEADARQN